MDLRLSLLQFYGFINHAIAIISISLTNFSLVGGLKSPSQPPPKVTFLKNKINISNSWIIYQKVALYSCNHRFHIHIFKSSHLTPILVYADICGFLTGKLRIFWYLNLATLAYTSMEIAGKKRERIIFFTMVCETLTSAICHCDKESLSASIVLIVFTIVSVEATTGLPLFGFGDAEARPCVNCWCQWKMVLQARVYSPHTSFIAACVCVGLF